MMFLSANGFRGFWRLDGYSLYYEVLPDPDDCLLLHFDAVFLRPPWLGSSKPFLRLFISTRA
jgi:hypothetical protein